MKKSVVFMALSMFSVQGAAYLAQFLLAGMLQPEQFAVVRTVEAAMQILSTVAPMGISLLVVRLAAQAGDASTLRRQLSSYLLLAGLAGLAVAGLSAAGFGLLGTRVADEYLVALVPVLVLSSVSRTALNFLYGREHFALISLTTFFMSLGYLAVLAVLAHQWGLDGWATSKYLVETLFLVIAFIFVRRHLGPVLLRTKDLRALSSEGVSISLSLMLRSAIDNVPLLVLGYLSASQADIAAYGLCTLLVAAGMILPASVNSVLLPRYGALMTAVPAELARQHKRFSGLLLGVGLLTAVAVVLVGMILPWLLGGKYVGITPLLSCAVLVIPLRAFTALNGNLLFVNRHTAIGTAVNAVGAVGGCLVAVFGYVQYGLWGVAIAGLIVELLMATAFGYIAGLRLKQSINLRCVNN